MVDDAGVGKTCLITRFVDDTYSSTNKSTIGGAAGGTCPLPGLRTAPHLPPWTIWRLTLLRRTPQQGLRSSESHRGLRSAETAASAA